MSNKRIPIMPLPDNLNRLTGDRAIHLDTIAEILDKLVPAFNTLQREFDEHVTLLQPAPADVPAVPSEAERIAELEIALDSVRGERDWFMAQLSEAKQARRTDPRLLAADKRREVAERALADAQQAAEHWATQYRAAAAKRIDANATAGRLACTIAGMEQEIAALRAERDTYRAQADAQRQAAVEATQRAEAAEAKWAALHSPRPAYQD